MFCYATALAETFAPSYNSLAKRRQTSVKTGIGQRTTTTIIIPYPWGPISLAAHLSRVCVVCVVPGTH